MRSSTETLIKALQLLAKEIESPDGVANAAIAESAGRMAELLKDCIYLENEMFKKMDERDAAVAQNIAFRKLLNMARDEYIDAHQDGETDCVTPYDVHDSAPVQSLRNAEADAIMQAALYLQSHQCTSKTDYELLEDFADSLRRGDV